MPRVSVIIPAYNPGDLLVRAIDSVLAQTIDDLEIIVVDDGSLQPQDWVQGYDRRIRYVRQSNRGVSIARNIGVGLASADLVAFLDQDDAWLPEKLSQQFELVADEPGAAFWCTGFIWTYPDREVPAPGLRAPTYLDLLSDGMALLSSAVVRVSDYWAVGGHHPLLAQTQDWDLFLRLAMNGRLPAMVETPLVRYYLHGNNASADYWTGALERFEVLRAHRRLARRRHDTAALEAIARGLARTGELYAHQAIDAARRSLRERDRRALAQHVGHAARLDLGVTAGALGHVLRTRLGS